jgi:Tol biopolymer transport system component
MTARRDTDRLIATWLTEIAPEGGVDYLDETLQAIGALGQRPSWTSPGRWLPMELTLRRVAVPRFAPYLAILALLVIAAIVALALAGAARLPAPFGLARTGQIAFVSGGDILVATANGQDRRTLIAGDGARWSPIWSHRGDRIAYWTAPAVGDPASLWVADPDGSNPRLVTGTQTFVVPDALPAVAWSPDDRRLAFATDAGVLYIVDADGGDLHPIGDDDHLRYDPVWSPDGTLIAYRGHALGEPHLTMSSWVITPAGHGDTQVIAARTGEAFTNSNPSWSLASDAFLVMTGVDELDISEARRDGSGRWSERVLIAGATDDNHPAWSNAGTRFSFIRVVPGAESAGLMLMVADADGSNPRQVGSALVGYSPQCWAPDDRFIRAIGPSDADPKILLIPLDGSPAIEIAVPDRASIGACQIQRLAP